MLGHEGRQVDDTYGPWPWIAGFAIGAFIIWMMFALSTGFA